MASSGLERYQVERLRPMTLSLCPDTLKKAAMVARAQKVVNFRDSLLYAGLNAEG